MAIEEDKIVDYKPSCTVDEAVAKMLGWLRGMYRDRLVPINEYGIPIESLPSAHSMGGPLIEQLNEMRMAARHTLFAAVEAGESNEVIAQKDEAGQQCEEKLALAYKYHLAIVDELAKEQSGLRIDKAKTESTGETHITLDSLDEWAYKMFSVSVKGDRQAQAIVKPDSDMDVESEISETGTKQKLTTARYNNLSTTFAFLLDAYLERCDDSYKHKDGTPIIKAIAGHLESVAKRANKGMKLGGQSAESIKDRIEEAIDIRKSKLPLR